MSGSCIRAVSLRAAAVLCLLSATGCLYDPSDRCGPNQELDDASRVCLCASGFGFSDGLAECLPCSDNEHSEESFCACNEGFAADASTGECAEEAAAPGMSCDPAGSGAECSGLESPLCVENDRGEAYCTSTGCSSAVDCGDGYECDTSATPSFCTRLPTGLGTSCSAQEDCAAFEASYCETFQVNTCMVAGCATSPDDCFFGFECRDLSSYGLENLCVPVGSGS